MKIRDRRKKGWFFIDNEFLDVYARKFGPVGTAVYVSLCRHADVETQECYPSMDLIANENNITRQTVAKYIKLFEKERIIAIKKEKNEKQQWKNFVYTLLNQNQWVSRVNSIDTETTTHVKPVNTGKVVSHVNLITEPCKTDSKSHVKPVNNKETHSKETHNKEASTSDAGMVVDVIKSFEVVNPACGKYYGNKTQRAAASNLIATYGFDQVSKVIAILPQTNKMAYVPTITTPYQLEQKWSQLEASLVKKKLQTHNRVII